MNPNEPLPLIERSEIIIFSDSPEIAADEKCNSLAFYGYLIIIATWLMFIVSVNSLFRVWSYVIYPLSLDKDSIELHSSLTDLFNGIDYYVFSCWSIYVVAWWWALISWCGLKLFRHSKGIQG